MAVSLPADFPEEARLSMSRSFDDPCVIPSSRLRNVREWHLHRIMILQSWGAPYSTPLYLARHVAAVRELDNVLMERDD